MGDEETKTEDTAAETRRTRACPRRRLSRPRKPQALPRRSPKHQRRKRQRQSSLTLRPRRRSLWRLLPHPKSDRAPRLRLQRWRHSSIAGVRASAAS